MIILYCIRETGKVRIKFHSFINQENQRFTNVYNNSYNCMFPKDIRVLGKFYKVPDGDIRLANRQNGKPFYVVKRSNIVTMTDEEKNTYLNPPSAITDLSTITIFDAGDCVICLACSSSIVFIPCGHRCVCSDCNVVLHLFSFKTPI